MKRLFIGIAACLLLFTACRRAEEKRTATAAGQHPVADDRAPYYPGLIEEYRTILAEDPDNLAATIALGNAYLESGAWPDAIRQYEQALERDPRNADVRTDLGTAYRNSGMPERALAEYRLALKYEPGHLNARYAIGMVYGFDLRNYGLAIHVWEELLRLAPNYPRADSMRSSMALFRNTLAKEHP